MNFKLSALLLMAMAAVHSQEVAAANPTQPAITIRRVALNSDSRGLTVEVSTSSSVIPQTQMLNNPDRLVIDFPGSIMGSDLHDIAVNRDGVVRIRVGLFTSTPPTTRVVVDLKSSASYQLSSQGEKVSVRLDTHSVSAVNQSRPASNAQTLQAVSLPVQHVAVAPILPSAPISKVQVSFSDGLLHVHSDKASMNDVLTEVQRKTGTKMEFPADAAQDEVFADLGPASLRQVLTALLDGSRFNIVMVGSESDPNDVKEVHLTTRVGGASQPTGNFVLPSAAAFVPPEGAPPPAPAVAPVVPDDSAPVELPEQEAPTGNPPQP
jgi:hypothetical protein